MAIDLLRTRNDQAKKSAWAAWQDYFSRMADRLSRLASDSQKKEEERKAEQEVRLRAEERKASGPAASSAEGPVYTETKSKRVLLLSPLPEAPVCRKKGLSLIHI